MNNRTMAIVYVDRDSISLKTRSRSGCSPQHFIILKKELQRLEEKKYLITKDIHSYAELRLCDAVGGAKVLEFSFTWLKDAGRDSVSGYTERIRLPYEPFRSYAAGEGETVDRTRWRLLSILEQNRPKLEFQSRKNLKAVVENPILRHKLGKFLDQHFNWYNYERIVLTDDYLPYSFFFEGLHGTGRKDLRRSNPAWRREHPNGEIRDTYIKTCRKVLYIVSTAAIVSFAAAFCCTT